MATGETLTKAVASIGQMAMSGDAAGLEATRNDLILNMGLDDPTESIRVIRPRVNDTMGYACGYLGPELGTQALTLLKINHPYFGDHIPDAESAYEAGKKIAKQHAVALQTQSEAMKKAAQAVKLGVMLPDSDEAVDNDRAAEILEALRKQRTKEIEAKLRHVEDEDLLRSDPYPKGGIMKAAVIESDLVKMKRLLEEKVREVKASQDDTAKMAAMLRTEIKSVTETRVDEW